MADQKTMPRVDDVVYIMDKKNKGPYKCTVLQVDDDESRFLIHWKGCGKRYDEWVTMDRIVAAPTTEKE